MMLDSASSAHATAPIATASTHICHCHCLCLENATCDIDLGSTIVAFPIYPTIQQSIIPSSRHPFIPCCSRQRANTENQTKFRWSRGDHEENTSGVMDVSWMYFLQESKSCQNHVQNHVRIMSESCPNDVDAKHHLWGPFWFLLEEHRITQVLNTDTRGS